MTQTRVCAFSVSVCKKSHTYHVRGSRRAGFVRVWEHARAEVHASPRSREVGVGL